jgi:hypothetical protein
LGDESDGFQMPGGASVNDCLSVFFVFFFAAVAVHALLVRVLLVRALPVRARMVTVWVVPVQRAVLVRSNGTKGRTYSAVAAGRCTRRQ